MSSTLGIDYSMTSPGVVFHRGSIWNPAQCHFWAFLPPSKIKRIESIRSLPSALSDFLTLIPYSSDQFESDFIRFNYLADAVCGDIIDVYSPDALFMEGYSYGSTGARLFNLVENTAVLKQKIMIERGLTLETIPPSRIKKFATGKGNVNKERLEEVFVEETGIDFRDILGQSPKSFNPSSDLIDAYYIAKWGNERVTRESNENTT